MVATPLNLQTLRGKAFEGFVQFQEPDGSTWYRLKERQSMKMSLSYSRTEHYSDDGTLAVDPSGHSHSFSMTIKLTTDMFDTQDPPTDKKTISYWIYKNKTHLPIQIVFVTSFPTLDSTTNNDVNIKFVLDPSGFDTGLGGTGGSPDITVSGKILSITSALKASTPSQ